MTNSASSPNAHIFLVRHGQSMSNAGGVTEDHVTNPLTSLGWTQAHDFAANFSCSPTLFVLSSFLRARQTAEPLRKKFPEVSVENWPIHEFTYLEPSRYNGTTYQQRKPDIFQFWQRCDPAYKDGPNAESFSYFLNRIRGTIRRLGLIPPGTCTILFTHSLWMQAFRILLFSPHATDAQLMANFRRFSSENPIQNLGPLEFEAADNQVRALCHHPFVAD